MLSYKHYNTIKHDFKHSDLKSHKEIMNCSRPTVRGSGVLNANTCVQNCSGVRFLGSTRATPSILLIPPALPLTRWVNIPTSVLILVASASLPSEEISRCYKYATDAELWSYNLAMPTIKYQWQACWLPSGTLYRCWYESTLKASFWRIISYYLRWSFTLVGGGKAPVVLCN